MLRHLVALLGGLAPPGNDFGGVSPDPRTLVVHDANIVLRRRIALICQSGPFFKRGRKFTLLIGAPSVHEIALRRRGDANENECGSEEFGNAKPSPLRSARPAKPVLMYRQSGFGRGGS
jgi:hypothetical protein